MDAGSHTSTRLVISLFRFVFVSFYFIPCDAQPAGLQRTSIEANSQLSIKLKNAQNLDITIKMSNGNTKRLKSLSNMAQRF